MNQMDVRVHSNVPSIQIRAVNYLSEGTNSSPGSMVWLGLGNLKPEAQASSSQSEGLALLNETMAWLLA